MFIFSIASSLLCFYTYLIYFLHPFASTFKASYCEMAHYFIVSFGETVYALTIDLSPDILFNDTWCQSVELWLRNFGFCKYWRTYGQRGTTLIVAVIG
jgi:hypothetical protein